MPRVAADVAAAASESNVLIVEMVKLDVSTGALFVHSGIGEITYNGDVYSGVGEYGSINGLRETEEFRPQPVNLSISGVDPSLISDFSTETVQGRDVDIFIALLNDDLSIIGEPIPVWSGYMDVPTTSISEDQAEILISCESRLSEFNKPRVSRYTDADQQDRFPGDRAFEFVDQVPNQTLIWGGSVVHSHVVNERFQRQ